MRAPGIYNLRCQSQITRVYIDPIYLVNCRKIVRSHAIKGCKYVDRKCRLTKLVNNYVWQRVDILKGVEKYVPRYILYIYLAMKHQNTELGWLKFYSGLLITTRTVCMNLK